MLFVIYAHLSLRTKTHFAYQILFILHMVTICRTDASVFRRQNKAMFQSGHICVTNHNMKYIYE